MNEKKADYKIAVESFGDLLHTPNTPEREWQKLFSTFPLILTESLPVRISSLYSQIELSSGRPDFVFVEESMPHPLLGYYGVIELKRPKDNILSIYNANHIYPSSKLIKAQSQVEHYLDELKHTTHIQNQYSLLIGHSNYSFIIMGCSNEIIRKCQTEIRKIQFKNLLPAGIELITYDSLFKRLRNKMKPVLILDLMPLSSFDSKISEPTQFRLVLDDDGGYLDEYHTCLLTTKGFFRIRSGIYKQVFGIPRKILPYDNGRWVDNYFYELRAKLKSSEFEDLMNELKTKNLPFEGLEIKGYFDSNNSEWKNRPEMKLYIKGEGVVEVTTETWAFNFYSGDKLYTEGGHLIVSSTFNNANSDSSN